MSLFIKRHDSGGFSILILSFADGKKQQLFMLNDPTRTSAIINKVGGDQSKI